MDLFTNTSYAIPHHSKKFVRLLYRQILCQSRHFFDDNCREFIKIYAGQRFRKWKNETNDLKRNNKISTARNYLGKLARANEGDNKSIQKILDLGYGRSGKLKYALLKKTTGFTNISQINTSVLKFKDQPEMQALYGLMVNQFGGLKKLKPPLSTGRLIKKKNLVNLQKQHYQKLIEDLLPPLPIATIKILEARANSGIINDLYISNTQKQLPSNLDLNLESNLKSKSKSKSKLTSKSANVSSNEQSDKSAQTCDPLPDDPSVLSETDPLITQLIKESENENENENETEIKIEIENKIENKTENKSESEKANVIENEILIADALICNKVSKIRPQAKGVLNSSKKFFLFQTSFFIESGQSLNTLDFAKRFNLVLSKDNNDPSDFMNSTLYSCHNLTVSDLSSDPNSDFGFKSRNGSHSSTSSNVKQWQDTWVKMPPNRVIRRAYMKLLAKSPYIFDPKKIARIPQNESGFVPLAPELLITPDSISLNPNTKYISNLDSNSSTSNIFSVQDGINHHTKRTENTDRNGKNSNKDNKLNSGSASFKYSVLSQEVLPLRASTIDIASSYLS